MGYQVILDPGHGGGDPGNQIQGRQEKDDTLKMALAAGQILERAGITVVYTRTDDSDCTADERVRIANSSGGDLFLSLHRTAKAGTEAYVFRGRGRAAEIADSINHALIEQMDIDTQIADRPLLAVLKGTVMPAVWLEVGGSEGFSDDALAETAQAIADGIMDALGGAGGLKQDLFRVQVGAYRNHENARNLLEKLNYQGFPAFIVYEGGFSKVQVGAFTNLENAVGMERLLKNYGYYTFIAR